MSVSIVPMDRGYRLRASCRVPAPLDLVFAFFSEARNLEALTPDRLHFRIQTEGPLEMREGLIIDYRITLGIVPMPWRSEITSWEPPHRFVDTQRRGPYTKWVHEHRFEPVGNATMCFDIVDYEVPGGAIVHECLVRRDLMSIFAFRERAMQRIFAEVPVVERASKTTAAGQPTTVSHSQRGGLPSRSQPGRPPGSR